MYIQHAPSIRTTFVPVAPIRIKSVTTTVYLSRPESQDLHKFHCVDCRTPILQYKGEAVKIVPGFNVASLPIVVQCSNSRCKRKYNFISFVEELNDASYGD